MDGDKQEKSAIEKMVDKINDAVENLVNTASEAAMKALEPEPPKNAAQPIASVPLAGDGLVSDPLLAMPPLVLAPAARKRAAPKEAAKESAKKSPGKTAKKAPQEIRGQINHEIKQGFEKEGQKAPQENRRSAICQKGGAQIHHQGGQAEGEEAETLTRVVSLLRHLSYHRPPDRRRRIRRRLGRLDLLNLLLRLADLPDRPIRDRDHQYDGRDDGTQNAR
jgi:hypothetical protein